MNHYVCAFQVVSIEEDDLARLADVSSDDEEEDQEADWMEIEASGSGRGLTDSSGKKTHASRKRARGCKLYTSLFKNECIVHLVNCWFVHRENMI